MKTQKFLNEKSQYRVIVFLLLFLFFSFKGFSQNINIKGVVTDQLDQPLPGATVLVKGTTKGVTTGFDGEYSLSVTENAVLTVSFLGFFTQELDVNGRTLINIELVEDSQGLDEVVVIGYGTVKKSDLTGSVVSIKTDKIADIPINTVGTLLQGRSTGLQIINISDDPEGGVGVRVRGASSLVGSREPLVVLDGIPFGTLADLNQLAPGDIESVEVLKDASAAAIYGSQGANGVILITTKKGKKDLTEVFVEMSTTLATYPEKIQRFTDMSKLSRLRNERDANDGAPILFSGQTLNEIYYPTPEEFDSGEYRFYDWLPVTRNMTPEIKNLRAGVRGGSEKNNYSLSLNYFDQEQNIVGASFNKINLLFNDAININNKMKIIASVNLANTNRVNGTGGDFTNGGKQWYPIYNEDGSYFMPFNGYTHQLELKDDYYNEAKGFDILTNLNMVWEPIAGLTFSSRASFTRLQLGKILTQNQNILRDKMIIRVLDL